MKLFTRQLLVLAGALLWVGLPLGALAGAEPEDDLTSQEKGTQDDLEDAIPREDLEQQQSVQQALENPRIVLQEDLQETSNLRVVQSLEHAKQEIEDSLSGDKHGETDAGKEHEDGIGERISDQGDRLMDMSRLPLTYIQEHVPFLTRRDIIFFGRLESDLSWYSSGVLNDESGFEIRRFKVGLAGQVKFWQGWNYKLEVDLTDGENTLSDAYMSWRWDNWGVLRIGNQKIRQSLSSSTSSVSTPFMERPLPVLAFTLNHRLGIGYHLHKWKAGTDITLFSQDLNEDAGSQGYSIRGYFNPTRSRFHVIHIGASWTQLSSDSDAQYRARPESNKTDIRLVDTGLSPQVDTGSVYGVEFAGARGPVTIRSELFGARWDRSEDSDANFDGWYVEASTFLTGEMAHYLEGKFIRPDIKSTNGAWEIAVRYSSVDLNDGNINGGEEKNLSLGLNWYSPTHWRFMGNLIKVSSTGPQGDQDPWIIQVRAQYYF